MELDAAKRCLAYLKEMAVSIRVFITDRHSSISKWMRQEHKDILHLYDLWHICKSVTKKLLKASKEKGCELLKEWTHSIRNHLHWCAQSTTEGFGKMILAKWKSHLRHVSGKHKDHPDKLFTKCAHGELAQPRKWIKVGKLGCNYRLYFTMFKP